MSLKRKIIPEEIQNLRIEKRRKYAREWTRKRYANDPEFRKKKLEASARWQKLHPHQMTPEEHVKNAKYDREWRKKHPEKVKAYTKKRMKEPRLQISQVRSRIKYYQKLLVKLEAQVKLQSEALLEVEA